LRRNKLAFTTSYTTRFPEYVEVRTMIPAGVGYALLRHFHSAASTIMVATASLRQELASAAFAGLVPGASGVDTELFNPDSPAKLDLPGPIFMTMGRVAVEKESRGVSFAGSAGNQSRDRRRAAAGAARAEYPDAVFLGEKKART